MKKALIILAHGSRQNGADNTIQRIAAAIRAGGHVDIVSYAFLQHSKPGPEEVLKECVEQGARFITIVPFFLQSGAHVLTDVPRLVSDARKHYPDIQVNVAEFVGSHPLMADIIADLVKKAASQA